MAKARAKDFVVNITKLTKAITQKGFGLIMIYDTEHEKQYAVYSDITAVGEAYPVDSKAYKLASRIFGQSPRPQNVAIVGNTNLQETAGTKGEFTLSITTPFSVGDVLEINGNKYTFAADNASADKYEFSGEDASSQAKSLQALVEKLENEFIVTSNLENIVFTQNTAGVGSIPMIFTSSTLVSAVCTGHAQIKMTKQQALPTGFIEFLNQVRDSHSEPFFLVCTDNTDATIKKLSNWIDTQDMMYFVTSQNLSAPKLVKSEQTVIMYHDDANAYVAEGLASYLATAKVGGVTSKFKTINGVLEANLTTTQLQELHKNNGFTYIEKMGVLQTTDGKTTSGEYIDVVMGAFWIRFKMEEEFAYLSVNTPKIGFDNRGIGLMVGVCNAVLKKAAFEQDIILIDSDEKAQYNITYVTRENTSKNDIANRYYTGIKWTAKLAGAIHKAVINGTLEY